MFTHSYFPTLTKDQMKLLSSTSNHSSWENSFYLSPFSLFGTIFYPFSFCSLFYFYKIFKNKHNTWLHPSWTSSHPWRKSLILSSPFSLFLPHLLPFLNNNNHKRKRRKWGREEKIIRIFRWKEKHWRRHAHW